MYAIRSYYVELGTPPQRAVELALARLERRTVRLTLRAEIMVFRADIRRLQEASYNFV